MSENFLIHIGTIEQYLINTHGQHNSHLIHKALPHDLTVPIPYALDQAAHHLKISTKYHMLQDSKWEKASTKAAEKKKAATTKKAKAAAASSSQPGPPRKRRRADGPALTQAEIQSTNTNSTEAVPIV
jgi:hypothetical protein